jgi:hypothetical protein
MQTSGSAQTFRDDDSVDLTELFRRLRRGIFTTLGLALLGLALAAVIYLAIGSLLTVTTSMRVVFSFPGFEKSEYPDRSKFSADDLRSPEIIDLALKRKGLSSTEETQSKVRSALSIQGIIPDNIVKERDKLRSLGQTPRPYVPDEYVLILSLPRAFPLNALQRQLLLTEIVSAYQEKFTRTYVALPINFGKAFEALTEADYFDYEMVLNQESQNITSFLTQLSETARAFRSARSNLSFSDLIKENQFFIQIRLNETLGLIRQNGLSKDRQVALLKMDYFLKTLGDEESKAAEEEKVVQSLLKQSQERMQNYVLGIKTQATQQRSESPILDQGLIDSLLANDANNFLVRKALDASLKTRRIQSDKAILEDRRNNMQTFIKSDLIQKTETLAQFQKSFDSLKTVYDKLISNIRITYEDYQRQLYNDAIRISMQPKSGSYYRGLALAGIAGLGIGMAAGLGLSLIRP